MAMRQRVERRTNHHDRATHDTDVETHGHAPHAAELKDDLDELLEEIDGLLEENAEEFVRAYVQKGGE
jgi:prokaryotic ubiquitin-like protein Pup